MTGTASNRTTSCVMPAFAASCVVPAFEALVPAGFPSPAADYVEGRIDLAKIFAPHPSATFTVRLSGHSMIRAGVHDGDVAIVDRSLEARHDDVVIAVVDGDLTCKRLAMRNGRTLLVPDSDDPRFRALDVTDRADFEIWGVVSATIRRHRR